MLVKSPCPGLCLPGPWTAQPLGLTDIPAAQKQDLCYLHELVTPPGDKGLKQESVSTANTPVRCNTSHPCPYEIHANTANFPTNPRSFSNFESRDPWHHPALKGIERYPQAGAGSPCSPEAVLHDAVPAASPAGTGVVALEDQGRLRHVELRQQPAVLGTDVQSGPSMAHH